MEKDMTVSAIQRVKWHLLAGVYYAFRIFPVKKNKILITNYFGKGFGDNAKYVVNELLKSDHKYDIVWAVDDMNIEMPQGVRKVKRRSLRGVYEESTAKVWMDNARKLAYVRKRKSQYYIQFWHGDTGLKKVEKDAQEKLTPAYIYAAKRDSAMANLFVSGSKWISYLYRNAFWYDGEIAECGAPRCDILVRDDAEEKEKIRKSIGIDPGEKVLLYAPTFRSTYGETDVSVYDLDWESVLIAFEKKFGGVWRGAIRLHPAVSALSEQLKLPDAVVDVTNYPDMQELLLISDCVISDYSSSVYEFARTGKVGFIFAKDYDTYQKDRDVYFSFDEAPFPIAVSNKEFLQNIEKFDLEDYISQNRKFYQEKFQPIITDQASTYIASVVQSICYE